ncbi:MAG: FtsX-like permease family protein [Chloroflexi bacterium]|nr:FtsX-like permease family protein [Chloroflexota bacterium]
MVNTEIKGNLLKPRWSKVFSDLWDNKLRSLLVVASIAVGVFSIGMIVSAYAILAEDINISYALVKPVNIEIWTDPFYEDITRIIERVPGVATAEGRRLIGVRGSRDGVAWQNLSLIVVTDFENMRINQLHTIEGTQFPNRREMLISLAFMNNSGFQVGEDIQIELPDGSIFTLHVVGLVGDQVTNAGDFTAPPKAYITLETLDSLGLHKYFNRLYVTVDGEGANEDEIAEISALVEEKLEKNQHTVYRSEVKVSNQHPMESLVLAVLGVLGALGGLITFLSGSLIINTLNALLTQHLRQIGIMKLIGGRSRQILGMYLVMIFIYGLIALILAVPFGAFAGYALADYLASRMNAILQGFRIIPLAIIFQVLIASLIPLGAGFFPIHNGVKTNVRRAITNEQRGNHHTRRGSFDRLTLWLRWVSRPILLSLRNTFRQKGRLLLTIFTLTVAGAIFIAVFNVRTSMAQFMDDLTRHFMGDVTILLDHPYPITRIKQVILPIPGVVSIEGWVGAMGEIWDANDGILDNIQIIAPPSNTSLLDPDIVAGRWLKPGEEKALVVSDSIYNLYPDLQPGDTIIVKIPGQREDHWNVVGVFRFIDMLGDTLAYADFDFIGDVTDLPNQSLSYKVTTAHHSLAYQQAMAQFIDQHLQDRGFMVTSIDAGLILQEDSSEGINILVFFLFIMASLTAFVGSIGLTGTMGMNVLERTREIGVMRAIGAVDLEVMKSVVIEGVFIGLITWLLAIGVSFPISDVLLNIISESMMGTTMDLTFTFQGVFIWLVVVVIISFLASILPARNAARLTIREVLAYE